jgi:hypothetical protein
MVLVVIHWPLTVGGSVSIPGQSVWNLWWTVWYWERFCSWYFGFILSIFPPVFHTHMSVIYYRRYLASATDSCQCEDMHCTSQTARNLIAFISECDLLFCVTMYTYYKLHLNHLFCLAVFKLRSKGSVIQLSKHPRKLSAVNLELKCKTH